MREKEEENTTLLRALLRHMQNEGQKVRKRGEERIKKRTIKGREKGTMMGERN